MGTFSALVLTITWHSAEFWHAGAELAVMDTGWNLPVRLTTLVSVAFATAWAHASLVRERHLTHGICPECRKQLLDESKTRLDP